MRILLLSFNIPTEASRAGKIAQFLLQKGHDVRVLSSPDGENADTRSSKLDKSRVLLTSSLSELAELSGQTILGRITRLYGAKRKTDRARGWHKAAVLAANELFETWKPDVIYATCPPHSTAVIAAQISRTSGIPFVVDFRERWADGVYSDQVDRRNQKDLQRERDILNRASAIITVSPVWAESYSNKYGSEKVGLAMDGFDPEQYPLKSPAQSDDDRKTLRLLYTLPKDGPEPDLSALFKGINILGEGAKDIRLTLVGANPETTLTLAQEERLERQIDIVLPEARESAIKRQYASDAFILAINNHHGDAGSIPEELFDYVGTRRPVIAMGYSKGVTAEIVRKRDLGVFSNEPKVIANRLAKLLAKKRAVGVVPFLPEKVRENASMTAQFSSIEPMLFAASDKIPFGVAAE